MWKSVSRATALFFASAVALNVSAQTTQDAAANWPNKPVRMIVAFAPGGGTDVLARLVAKQLTMALGQPFVVENKAGGSGIIAVDTVMGAAPDGYTLLVGGSAPLVFNHIVFKKLSYTTRDITPVTVLGSYPLVIGARNDLGVKNFHDLIQLAKSKPGKLSYGHAGPTFEVQMEYLANKAGIKMLPVPYKGGGPAALAIMAGDIDLIVADTATIEPLHRAGKARAIAVTTKTRNPALAEVQTVSEAGVPDVDASAFAALGVHHNTPPAIINKLHLAVVRALATAEVRERLTQLGIEAGGMSPAETAARIKREIDIYTPVAEAAGLRGTE